MDCSSLATILRTLYVAIYVASAYGFSFNFIILYVKSFIFQIVPLDQKQNKVYYQSKTIRGSDFGVMA